MIEEKKLPGFSRVRGDFTPAHWRGPCFAMAPKDAGLRPRQCQRPKLHPGKHTIYRRGTAEVLYEWE